MSFKQISALLIVLLMCSMPVAGMLEQIDDSQTNEEPIAPQVMTGVYGWVTVGGVTPMNATTVVVQDVNNATNKNQTTTNATGFYTVSVDVTSPGQEFIVYSINRSCFLHQNDIYLDPGVPEEYNISMNLAPARNATVKGFLTDSRTGGPINDTSMVAFSGHQPEAYFNSTATNATGYFEMGLVPAGGNEEYGLSAELDGFDAPLAEA